MLYLVFDLDQTLYQLDQFQYEKLEPNPYLNFLLDMLPYKKIVFTNATTNHALKCLDKLEITEQFERLISRDTIQDFKPFKSSYEKFINLIDINDNDIIFFFEDTIENLQMAKTFGWHTFYIGNKNTFGLSYVDMSFKTIENVLEYFLEKKNNI